MIKNTKSLFILFSFLMLTLFGYAQKTDHEIDLIQQIFGLEKTDMLSDLLGEVNDDFWEIYKEYEVKRMALGRTRLALINDYATSYDHLTDDKIDQLLKSTQTQSKDLEKLINGYTKKIKKVSGSKVAAQFYQIETYLLAAVRVKIMENIPLVGELDPKY